MGVHGKPGEFHALADHSHRAPYKKYNFKGRVIIKKRGNFSTMTQIGGGDKDKAKLSEIQIRTFQNPWGGGLNFSKMSVL